MRCSLSLETTGQCKSKGCKRQALGPRTNFAAIRTNSATDSAAVVSNKMSVCDYQLTRSGKRESLYHDDENESKPSNRKKRCGRLRESSDMSSQASKADRDSFQTKSEALWIGLFVEQVAKRRKDTQSCDERPSTRWMG